MGNWMSRGPRQPTGLTPASRYIFMVSWESLLESPLYLSRSFCILGCRAVMARICRICLRVRGVVRMRMMMVKAMMERPMLLNSTE